jgi:hypothetical protein
MTMHSSRGGNARRLSRLVLVLGLGTGLLAALHTGEVTGQPPPKAAPSASVNDADVIAYINAEIRKGWADNQITPSKYATENEWLRRTYLDIVGRIPTVKEINNYTGQAGTSASKRAALVRDLMKSTDYAENWANLWTVWLITRTAPAGVHREKLRSWLQESFAINKKYDQLVTEVLTATGKCDEVGPANYVASLVGERVPNDKRARDGFYEMVPATARTTRLFLGHQTQCTQCHNHPFIDERKQAQFWGLNVFFRQVTRTPDLIMAQRNMQTARYYTLNEDEKMNRDSAVFYETRQALLLRTSAIYLDGTRAESMSPGKRREALAKFLIKDDLFAKAIVNRMWAHFFGRGFSHPFDDFGEHNPVSHTELLDKLAKDFIASGYDLRRLITWISLSEAYSLSSIGNPSNSKQEAEPFFARMNLKAMTPEQLVDSIFTATSTENAVQDPVERRRTYDEWLRDFTVNFGDDEGNEATFNGTVVQALLLLNGPRLNEAVKSKTGNTVERAAAMGPKGINYIYQSALGRAPTAQENKLANQILAQALKLHKNDAKVALPIAYQDILWALLNSNEFILNH